MTDFENREPQGQESVPQPEAQPQPVPQEAPAPEEPAPQAEAAQETPQAAPYQGQVPHLTLDPDEPQPFAGDPFQNPEPPRAPEPPQPDFQQPAQQEPPAYGAPQYGAGQYQPPQYTQPPQQNYYQQPYGAPQYGAPQYAPPTYTVPPAGYVQKSRMAAGLLGIMFGWLGVHNFYLGFTTRGVVQLLVALVGGIFTCGVATFAMVVWGFVEGVLLLSASPSRMYDGHGVILRD